MEKITKANIVFATLILLGLRALIVEPGIGFALTAIVFAGLVGFRNWQDAQIKTDINSELRKELDDIRTNVSGLMMRNAAKSSNHNSQQEARRFF